ncbi:MAG: MBL fold metallo-hydrolase [Opitutaceae bacterium]|nr:MBL fold metallo-hydrolase [Opitutaceae bacterium]
MDIRIFPAGYIDTNAYLLIDREKGEAVLIDAPHDLWPLVESVLKEEECKLTALFLTHGHWDHTGDAALIQSKGATLYAHPDDRVLIETPETMGRFLPPGVKVEGADIDEELSEGQVLDVLSQKVEIRHVPGHCPGNILLYFEKKGIAFVGDALFRGSIGRTDLPNGNFAELEKSIRERIYTLPENTIVYPGHGPDTSVGFEMKSNPHVKAQ